MSGFTELNFRENHAYKYFDVYDVKNSAIKNYHMIGSEVLYEIKEKRCRFSCVDFDVPFGGWIC